MQQWSLCVRMNASVGRRFTAARQPDRPETITYLLIALQSLLPLHRRKQSLLGSVRRVCVSSAVDK